MKKVVKDCKKVCRLLRIERSTLKLRLNIAIALPSVDSPDRVIAELPCQSLCNSDGWG